MRRILVGVIMALTLLFAIPAIASASNFTRLYSDLPAYTGPSQATLDVLTAGAGPPAGPMFDPNADGDDNEGGASWTTYFGQGMVDHETTLDLRSSLAPPIDPTTINNFRTPEIDLDQVYGGGPRVRPDLYDVAGRFLLAPSGRDFVRDADGQAVIVDGRNDENQVVAQVQVAFMRFHNALIDKGLTFRQARKATRHSVQRIVAGDFLRNTLDPVVYDDVFRWKKDGTLKVKTKFDGGMPVEFSSADFRVFHSAVRRAYTLLQGGARVQVFNPANTAADLHGGRPIGADRIIFWDNFVHVDSRPDQVPPQFNRPREFDGMLSSGLFGLPIPGAAADGSSVLARRNIERAAKYGLPSGQAVARELGLTPITNDEFEAAIPRLQGVLDDPSYAGELPLWLYSLLEAEVKADGNNMGPVASRIVAETLGANLANDDRSFINQGASKYSVGRFQDVIREAGLLQ